MCWKRVTKSITATALEVHPVTNYKQQSTCKKQKETLTSGNRQYERYCNFLNENVYERQFSLNALIIQIDSVKFIDMQV